MHKKVRDVIKREDARGGVLLDGGFGHIEEDGRVFVLGDGDPAFIVEFEHAFGAVLAHAGEEDSDAGIGEVFSIAFKEDVDGGAIDEFEGIWGVGEEVIIG